MNIVKYWFTVFCIITVSLTSCSQNKQTEAMNQNKNKAIVCYFSATGTTASVAKRIAELTGADIIEIVPETPYTAEDLDWTDSLSRSSVEMRNRNTIRPAIKDSDTDFSEYSLVYLGYPNWWNTHPAIINTFLEANDLKNIIIVPFMTSGGSDITNSEKELKEQYPDLTFGKGMLMNGKSDREIKEWAMQYR